MIPFDPFEQMDTEPFELVTADTRCYPIFTRQKKIGCDRFRIETAHAEPCRVMKNLRFSIRDNGDSRVQSVSPSLKTVDMPVRFCQIGGLVKNHPIDVQNLICTDRDTIRMATRNLSCFRLCKSMREINRVQTL